MTDKDLLFQFAEEKHLNYNYEAGIIYFSVGCYSYTVVSNYDINEFDIWCETDTLETHISLKFAQNRTLEQIKVIIENLL